jgi:hypothetical protein
VNVTLGRLGVAVGIRRIDGLERVLPAGLNLEGGREAGRIGEAAITRADLGGFGEFVFGPSAAMGVSAECQRVAPTAPVLQVPRR